MEQKTERAPGPWEVRYGHGDDADRVYGIYAANGELVVETDSGVYPPETSYATLIAAAPELYEALRDLLTDSVERSPEKWHAAKRAGRAALAKARP